MPDPAVAGDAISSAVASANAQATSSAGGWTSQLYSQTLRGIISGAAGMGANQTAPLGGASSINSVMNASASVAAQDGSTALNLAKQQDAQDQADAKQGAQAAGGALSVICTYLMSTGKMPRRQWYDSMSQFVNYPFYKRHAYHIWAVPALQHMRAHSDSYLTKVLTYLFLGRARGNKLCWLVVQSTSIFCGLFSKKCWCDFLALLPNSSEEYKNG